MKSELESIGCYIYDVVWDSMWEAIERVREEYKDMPKTDFDNMIVADCKKYNYQLEVELYEDRVREILEEVG